MGNIFFIVLDGAADRKIKALKGKTPLEYASIPCLDRLAQGGQQSMIEILPDGLAPETDSGIMALLGYPPMQYYSGRGTLECMGLDKYRSFRYFVGFRVNFASLDHRSGILDRRTMRDLSEPELQQLADELQEKVTLDPGFSVQFELVAFGKHRGILSFYSKERELSGNVSNTDPGFEKVGMFSIPNKNYENLPRKCVPLDTREASAVTAAIVNDFVEQSKNILENSSINRKRREQGLPEANVLLFRDGGSNPIPMPEFAGKYGKHLAVYGQLPCEKAMADMIGADFHYTESFEVEHDKEILRYLADVLREDPADIVFCHLKGPDEPGHDGKPEKKVAALEQIDSCFMQRLLERRETSDVFVITCDHATPCELGIHSGDRVPLLISGGDFAPDGTEHFHEEDAGHGGCKVKRAIDIFDYLCGSGI